MERSKYVRFSDALYLCVLLYCSTLMAGDGIWNARSGNWNDASNWIGGLPDGAGDSATIPDDIAAPRIALTLSTPITIAELESYHGAEVRLRGSGELKFSSGGSGMDHITVGSRGSLVFDVPLSVYGSEDLVAEVVGGTLAQLRKPISGSGTLIKTGLGELLIDGASSAWTGPIEIRNGTLRASEINLLGSADRGTTIRGGSQLDIETKLGAPIVVLEPFTLDGGIMTLAASANTESVTFAGPMLLDSDSIFQEATDLTHLYFQGPISGNGGLTIISQPRQRFAKIYQLSGSNTYAGTTVINTGHFLGSSTGVQVTSATGLGDIAGPTIIQSGSLLLGEGTAEPFFVEAGGVLSPSPSSSPHSGAITIRGGVLHAGSRTTDNEDGRIVEITGPIRIEGGAQFGRSSFAGNPLKISGDVSGYGSLLIENDELHDFVGAVTTLGDVNVGNRGSVKFSAGFAPAGDLRIVGESLPGSVTWTESVENFTGNVYARHGGLTVLADSRLGDLRIDKRSQELRPDLVRAGASIAPGATLTIDGTLHFVAGSLHGNIQGPAEIVKTSRFDGALGGLSEFTGDVRIEGGAVVINQQGFGAPGGLNSILARHNANFTIHAGVRIDEDVHLNDSSGFGFNGSLVGDGEFAGDVYLGNEGSYVGGRLYPIDPRDAPLPADLEISGAIHGGTLFKGGSTVLTLSRDGHTYTGATHVIAGELHLSGPARLTETSEIIVRDGSPASGGLSRLTLNNMSTAESDRIADDVPVKLIGGQLQMLAGNGIVVDETLAVVTAEAGLVYINAEGGGSASLAINNLDRKPGSIVQFNVVDGATIELPNAILDDGLIGGWAVFGPESRPTDFATLGSNGVAAYADIHSYQTDLTTADEHDNVFTIENVILPRDAKVNALQLGTGGSVDLGGHSLTVESGGVLATDGIVHISSGEIAAGATSSELTLLSFTGIANIDAQITDGDHGPTGFHAVGIGEVHLTGENDYSGPTTVSRGARLYIDEEAALPADSDIVLNGGRLIIAHNDATLLDMGHVVIRQHSTIEGSTLTEIEADSYELYAGRIELPLAGFGDLRKRGEGTFEIYSQNPFFGGQIVVEQGVLDVGTDAFLGSGRATEENATIVRQDGVLTTRGEVFEELLILDGGTLRGMEGNYDGPIEVRRESTVEAVDNSSYALSGPITGSVDLVLDGPLDDVKRLIVASPLDNFGGDLLVRGGNVEFAVDNRNYQGNVMVRALEATVAHPYGLGAGVTTVTPVGTLAAEGLVHARIEMAGGSFRGALRSATLTQPVIVTADSTIETPFLDITPPSFVAVNFESTVDLADDVGLKQVGPGSVRFRDQVVVRGNVKLTSFEGRMDLDGTVVAAAPATTLNLEGTNSINLRGAVQVPEGNTFQLLRNGSPAPIVIRRSGKLEGGGTVLNDVEIGLGGSIQPGPAIGLLTATGQVSLESAGVYHWEINDGLGLEGAPTGNGWDLVVADRLDITAIEDEPFVVRISGIGVDDQLGSVANFDPAKDYEWSLIRSGEIAGFQPSRLTADVTSFLTGNPAARFGSFSIVADEGDLLLNYRPVSGAPDFDQDHNVDADDIDLLYANLGSPDLFFDLNNDGTVDRQDVDELILDGFGTQYGDANLDYAVNAADFAIWNTNNFHENAGWATADFNGDGNTDAADFNLWLDNQGFVATPSSVPEPRCLSLLVAVMLWLLSIARRRRTTHRRASLSTVVFGKIAASSVIVVVVAVGATAVSAQTMRWINRSTTPGDWHDPANWFLYTPGEFFEFSIDNGGTAQISGGQVVGARGSVGQTKSGTLIQTGGELILQDDSWGRLILGEIAGASGRFELAGGSTTVRRFLVGFFGSGEFEMTGGVLNLEGDLTAGDSSGGYGTVIHTGGTILGIPHRPVSEINVGGTVVGAGEYQLYGDGKINVANINVRDGRFVQSGGSVDLWEGISVLGLPGRDALFLMDNGAYLTQTRSVTVGGNDAVNSTFEQHDGWLEASFVYVDNGMYLLNQGWLEARDLNVRAVGQMRQNGGAVYAHDLELESGQESDASDIPAVYELNGGMFRTHRLQLDADSGGNVMFDHRAGLIAVNALDLRAYEPSASSATYRTGGGELVVHDRLSLAEEEVYRAEFDFQNQETLIHTGIGSFVRIGPNVAFRNAEQTTLRLGSESLLVIPETVDLSSTLGSFEHDNVVVYHPGQDLNIAADQRTNIGGLQLTDRLVVDGYVYDTPLRDGTRISKWLRINTNGVVNLGRRSRVHISDQNAGVFGGVLNVDELVVQRTSDHPAIFTVDDNGEVTAQETISIVGENSRFEHLSGRLDANVVEVREGGLFRQSGGEAIFAGVGLAPLSRSEVRGGRFQAKEMYLASDSLLRQTNGTVEVGQLRFGDALYELSGGLLKIDGQIQFDRPNGAIDFGGSDASLSLVGAMLFSERTNPFRNSRNASLVIDENSLVFVPAGTNITSQFGSVTNQGLISVLGSNLTIPQAVAIHGSGDLSSAVARLEIHGQLIADSGMGINIGNFHIQPGANVDLGRGGASTSTNFPSMMTGGNLRARTLLIEPTPGSQFVQTGGDATFERIIFEDGGKYELHGGSLTIESELRAGVFDFAGSDASLIFGERAFVELDKVRFISDDSVRAVSLPGSLIVIRDGFPPESYFGTFEGNGLIQSRGQVLEIPPGEHLAANAEVYGGVANGGLVSPGNSAFGEVIIRDGDYRQRPTGTLEIQVGQTRNNIGVVFTDSDRISVFGDAILDGTLIVDLMDGFRPVVGDEFLIVDAEGVTGTFRHFDFPELSPGMIWDVEYVEGEVTLKTIHAFPTFGTGWLAGDFNGSGTLGADDIDLLAYAIRRQSVDKLYDLDGSGFVDQGDLRQFVEEELDTQFGDLNLDGVVDDLDFEELAENLFRENSNWAAGDFNGDGFTDVSDFNLWLSHRDSPAADTSHVPEPSALCLAYLCLAAYAVFATRPTSLTSVPMSDSLKDAQRHVAT